MDSISSQRTSARTGSAKTCSYVLAAFPLVGGDTPDCTLAEMRGLRMRYGGEGRVKGMFTKGNRDEPPLGSSGGRSRPRASAYNREHLPISTKTSSGRA